MAEKKLAVKRIRKQALRNKSPSPDMGESMKTGVTYVSSWGTIDRSEISASDIQRYRNNVYAKGVGTRQKRLIFTERPTVNVYDKRGDANDELRDEFMAMGDRNGLHDMLHIMYDELFWYGAGFINPVPKKEGSRWVLDELNHLPSDSFTQSPQGAMTVYSNVLQGVTLEDGEIVYYQQQDLNDYIPVKLESNVLMLKDPTEPGLAGSPIILPLIAVLKMLDFAWDAQIQFLNRFGAGTVVFIEVTNGTGEDITYAQKLLKNWGRKTSYVLKDNMKVVTLDMKGSDSAMPSINALNQILIEFFSPASSITKEGSFIGGSDWGAAELLKSYIGGIHRMLETFANAMYQPILDANYKGQGLTVEWTMPTMSIDRSEINIKQAQVGYDTRSLMKNEIRTLLGQEELDEEGLAKLVEEYKSAPAPGVGGVGGLGAGMNEENADGTPGDVLPIVSTDPVQGPAKKVEVKLEDQIKTLYDKLADEVIGALEHEGA